MTAGTGEDKIKLTRTRSMRRNGGSVVVTIPPEFFELTQFSEGDAVELEVEPGVDEVVITRTENE